MISNGVRSYELKVSVDKARNRFAISDGSSNFAFSSTYDFLGALHVVFDMLSIPTCRSTLLEYVYMLQHFLTLNENGLNTFLIFEIQDVLCGSLATVAHSFTSVDA